MKRSKEKVLGCDEGEVLKGLEGFMRGGGLGERKESVVGGEEMNKVDGMSGWMEW